jgi:hypothetical protein
MEILKIDSSELRQYRRLPFQLQMMVRRQHDVSVLAAFAQSSTRMIIRLLSMSETLSGGGHHEQEVD